MLERWLQWVGQQLLGFVVPAAHFTHFFPASLSIAGDVSALLI
jgi:hypothetical protein